MKLPFEYPVLLWLLLLVPAAFGLYFYSLKRKQKSFQLFGDPALVAELTANYNRRSFFLKFFFAATALLLILLSIANLRSRAGVKNITRNGIDVMIALDVSKSMLAEDVQPTRLDRAKQLLDKLMDKLDNDRIGLVVFAGKAYLQMPLTADHSAAKMYLSAATPATVPTQGTVIGDALKACYASFNKKEKKYKAVVLISDGEDHDENAVKIAGEMADEGIVISTVGIGSPGGATIPDEATNEPKKDNEGNVVVTKLNEQELAEIASKGNGQYQLFSNTDAVTNALYSQLSTLDQHSVSDDSLVDYRSLFPYLLGLAFLLLVAELFISEVKKSAVGKVKAAAIAALLFISLPAMSQTDREAVKKGNDAYLKKDYPAAQKNYDEALKKNNADFTAQYNMGNALYKSDKKDDAVNAFDKAQKNMPAGPQRSAALYNKGVALQADNKLDECITAYEEALKNNPDNEDARHNLEIALRQKHQQDQKKNDDQKKQQQNNPNQNKQNNKNTPPPPGGMSQKDADQKLQALAEKEKGLQDKLHKVNAAAPEKPEKDW